jgi:translation initiation factor 1
MVCAKCGWPAKECKCSKNLDEEPPEKIIAKLRIEKSGRGGKTVTVIYGLPRNKSFLEDLASELKKACGSGGKAGAELVEIQGDQRDAIRGLLQKRGWVVKG